MPYELLLLQSNFWTNWALGRKIRIQIKKKNTKFEVEGLPKNTINTHTSIR